MADIDNTAFTKSEPPCPTAVRELLLGCGNRRDKLLDPARCFTWNALTTIDHDPLCGADITHDLEQLPWPLEDDTFDEVHAYCVLEHLGRQGDARSFFAHFGEIWRVLKPGGLVMGICPSARSNWAWGDPSHTRIISAESLVFLDQGQYAAQIGVTPMTDFRWLWHGDFECVGTTDDGEIFKFGLIAHKPARSFADARPEATKSDAAFATADGAAGG